MTQFFAIALVLISSAAAADSMRSTTATYTLPGAHADLSCNCVDLAKPGYECKSCSISPGKCQCTYDLKLNNCTDGKIRTATGISCTTSPIP
jgi:hypothetical protein